MVTHGDEVRADGPHRNGIFRITIACTGVAAAHFSLCLHVKSRHLGDAYRYPTEKQRYLIRQPTMDVTMKTKSLGIFLSGRRIGSVIEPESLTSFFRGRLVLDDCKDYALFEIAVEFASIVDRCPASDYQASWERWRRCCGEIQDLNLWIGNSPTPVQDFAIESDWMIEWRDMDTEFT